MKKGKRIRNLLATIIVCISLVGARPSHAFIPWPCIDPSLIGQFVGQITSAVGQISGVKTQIDNITKQIHAFGSQLTAAIKYAKSLKDQIMGLINQLTSLSAMIQRTALDVDGLLKNARNTMKESFSAIEAAASKAVEVVEQQIAAGAEALDDIKSNLEEAKDTTLDIIKDHKALLEDTRIKVNDLLSESENALRTVFSNIEENLDLRDEVRETLRSQATSLQTRVADFKENALEMLANATNLNEQQQAAVEAAYAEYGQAIESYTNGEIDAAAFEAAGAAFREKISGSCEDIDEAALNKITTEAQSLASDINDFMEEVANTIANSLDYQEDDEPDEEVGKKLREPVNPILQKFSFHYSSEHPTMYLKVEGEVYDGPQFIYAGELGCNELKIDDLKEAVKSDSARNSWMKKFKDCALRAKTDKTYNCGKNGTITKEDLAKCNPFEDPLYEGLEEKTVYKQIYEDYSLANIAQTNQTKAYVTKWFEERPNEFEEVAKGGGGDNQQAWAEYGIVEIHPSVLWSKIGLLDSLERNKNIVNYFSKTQKLYSDDETNSASESGNEYIPAVFANLCELDITKDDMGVEKAGEMEEKFKDCFYKYVKGATYNTPVLNEDEKDDSATEIKNDKGQVVGEISLQQQWREKEEKALQDAEIQAFAKNTIGLYQGNKVDMKDSDEDNAASMQESFKSSNDYTQIFGGLAQMTEYTTKQLLAIIDADALHLQTEIIQDLRLMTYNFFDKDETEEGN